MSDVLVVVGSIALIVVQAWLISHATIWLMKKWENRR